jgi:hypothetical protein
MHFKKQLKTIQAQTYVAAGRFCINTFQLNQFKHNEWLHRAYHLATPDNLFIYETS